MVELRKHEKEEKALRREQVSDQSYFNYNNCNSIIDYINLYFLCL